MPEIRPFRGLRYVADTVGDLGAVVAPPYDVIAPEQQAQLIARHEKNVVRLDLPPGEQGDESGDERYRRAARTLAAWRSDGTLHKDPRPAVYVYEQIYRVPGTDIERTQRGFFARLRLEAFGPDAGVRPHEKTLAGPREDRYRLLRATGVNTSPVVGLYDDPTRSAAATLAGVVAGPPRIAVVDDEGVGHRLWVVEADAEGAGTAGSARSLIEVAGGAPVTIADGHHRYETALRYRDERRMSRSCEEDPAFDYILMLFLAANEPLTVLPTHRVVRGLAPDGLAGLPQRLAAMFEVRPAGREELERTFGTTLDGGGQGRFGLWTKGEGVILTARREAFDDVDGTGDAVRGLDVWLLGAALERFWGIDAAAVAGGERVAYSKSAADAIERVESGADGSDAAFLLDPTPVASITAVAEAGEVMPQKSTYFYPKALTGLVINPHEW